MAGSRGTTPRSRFDKLFDEAVPHVLGRTHICDVVPRTGGRWPISAALLLPPTQALPLTSIVEQMLPLVGPHHFLTGRPAALHVTVRALEHRRENVPPDDPAVAGYLSAIRHTASQCAPVRLQSRGLTLTATGVMAALEPTDGAASRLTAVLEQELGQDGWCEAGFDRTIWYATLLHFAAPILDPEGLVAFIAKRRRLNLGIVSYGRLSLVGFDYVTEPDGSSYMAAHEIGAGDLVDSAGPSSQPNL